MNEETLFAEAVAIDSPQERATFLDEACAGNAALRTAVDRLLALHESARSFLEQPPAEVAAVAAVATEDPAATIVHGSGSTTDDEDANSAGPAMNDDLDDEIPLGYLQPSSQPNSLGRLGHYEILEVVGRGAFGTVLRAFDEKLQRVVAIKVLAPEMAATSPARKRFLREARTSAAIRHENVVAIHAVEDEPIPYLVMEYIPGKTLQQRLDEQGPLDLADVLRLGKQIADGLAAAHAQGLIHRDIKPGNILLEGGVTERVKITDFGLARTADDASLTQSGLIAGTPMYMAPEQAQGQKLDQRADLFSLGSVLYQMLSGRPPFRAANTVAVLRRVVEDAPRPIPEIIPEVPEWVCRLIGHLHAKQPDDRYQTAQEISELLGRCLDDLKAGRMPTIPGPHAANASAIVAPSEPGRVGPALPESPVAQGHRRRGAAAGRFDDHRGHRGHAIGLDRHPAVDRLRHTGHRNRRPEREDRHQRRGRHDHRRRRGGADAASRQVPD
jgi:eukaryotic-like serine/threonine-protein kinase